MRRLIASLVGGVVFGLVAPPLEAACTPSLADGNQATVQAAINAAANGDVICMPSGTWTWSTSVSVPNTKGLTLAGQGVGSTIINNNTATNKGLIEIRTAAGNALTRVTDLTLDYNGVSKSGDCALINIGGAGVDSFRIDHVTFDHLLNRAVDTMTTVDGFPITGNAAWSGLIDHVTVHIAANATVQGMSLNGTGPEDDTPFARGYQPGTNQSVYIEDSTFTFDFLNDSSIDAFAGMRYVFRYNTVTGTQISHHGADSGGYRGVHTFEMYRNTFSNSNGSARWMFFRSGSGYIFDNTASGNYTIIGLSVYRARPETFVAKYGQCDPKSAGDLGSPSAWDGNTGTSPTNYGWPCLDQTGYIFTQNSGGAFTKHALYSWSNLLSSVETAPQATEVAAFLVANRDFYSKAASFDGTAGIGVGTLASRPATCTTGVGYWATDRGSWNVSGSGSQGLFYECTAANTWTQNYTPYTYPHPLQNAGGTHLGRTLRSLRRGGD